MPTMSDAAGEQWRGDAVIPTGRLVGWLVLVTSYAALAYAVNFGNDEETPDDALYLWSTAIGGAVLYAILLAIVLAMSRGIDRDLLGLRRPPSWPRALGTVVVAFVTIAVVASLLNLVLEAGEEQGLVPDEWDSGRAAPFVANFVVVASLGPFVEELTYRGLGFAVTRDRLGVWPAVAITAVYFGLAHGLLIALPVLTIFGVVLAVVRERTQSLYPAVLLHAIFNGMAVLLSVTVGGP
jgi:CAAX protease family protein